MKSLDKWTMMWSSSEAQLSLIDYRKWDTRRTKYEYDQEKPIQYKRHLQYIHRFR